MSDILLLPSDVMEIDYSDATNEGEGEFVEYGEFTTRVHQTGCGPIKKKFFMCTLPAIKYHADARVYYYKTYLEGRGRFVGREINN